MGNRNFANLQVGVLIADKIVRKAGQLLMISLRTLQIRYIIPDLAPTGLRDLLVSSDIPFIPLITFSVDSAKSPIMVNVLAT